MIRRSKIILSIAIVAVLMLALKIRSDDAGYIAYMDGDRAAAIPDLEKRVKRGDSHAALLLGQIYAQGYPVGSIAPKRVIFEQASKWYLKAAEMGDIRAVRLFLDIALAANDSHAPRAGSGRCKIFVRLLNMAAAAGDAGANVMLGGMYKDGAICLPTDKLKAAQFFYEASNIDPHLSFFLNAISKVLSEKERADLRSPFSAATDRPTARQVLQEFRAFLPGITGR